jgi:hypothetical protein
MGISIPRRIGGEPHAIGVAEPKSRLKQNFEPTSLQSWKPKLQSSQ